MLDSMASRALFMIIGLQTIEKQGATESPLARFVSTESSMIAEHATAHRPGQPKLVDRKLRNRLILANAVAWIAVLAAIYLIFF
jgi:hypothetical protein